MEIGLILDIVLVALIVLVAYVSAKKGFLLLIMDIAASIAAFIGARIACAPVAEYVYANYLHETVLGKTSAYVAQGADSVTSVLESINGALVSISPSLDGIVEKFGLFSTLSEEQTGLTAQTLEGTYLAPVITGVLTALAMALIAAVLLVVLRVVARILDKVIIRKPLKKINESLGWILGLVKGVIPVLIIACIMVVLAPVLNAEKISELVDTSYICSFAAYILEKASFAI